MFFYCLTQLKDKKEPSVKVVKAYKDTRWKGNAKRPYEISLLLDDGNTIQINPNDIINDYMTLRRDFMALENSTL